MRLLDERAGGSSATLRLLLTFGILLCSVMVGTGFSAAAESDELEVAADSGGGVRATAHVLFPAGPAIVQELLTDYPHWPDLFEVQMRVADLHIHDGITTVDLRIDYPLMPGERRLVTESRILPGGGLVTDLSGGDFKRYHRVWKLQPVEEGNRTRGDFELVLEPDFLVPDWLVAMMTRRELEAHFRILKQKASEQAKH